LFHTKRRKAAVSTATTGAPTVLVVDDHQLVTGAIAVALRARGVAAAAMASAAFVQRVDHPAPDGGLVLPDLTLGPGVDGVEFVPRLRTAGWQVLVVTGSVDESRLALAVTAEALDRVSKSAPFDELVATAVRATQGRPLLTDAERERLRAFAETVDVGARRLRELWARLTPREPHIVDRIVDRIVEGRRATTIAEEFVVSIATVRTQIRSILTKLEVRSQLEVAALVRELRPPR